MKINKIKLSRRFEEDIWGNIVVKGKLNKVMQYFQNIVKEKREKKKRFVFRVDVINPKRKRGKLSNFYKLLKERRKILAFYGFVRKYQLKRILKVSKELQGNVIDNTILSLEMRLITVIYRMNFCNTIFEAKQRIKEGYILVNKEVITLPNFRVKEGDIIEIKDKFKNKVYNLLLENLKNNRLYINLPKYIDVNYRIMSGVFLYKPGINEIPYPFKFKRGYLDQLVKFKY